MASMNETGRSMLFWSTERPKVCRHNLHKPHCGRCSSTLCLAICTKNLKSAWVNIICKVLEWANEMSDTYSLQQAFYTTKKFATGNHKQVVRVIVDTWVWCTASSDCCSTEEICGQLQSPTTWQAMSHHFNKIFHMLNARRLKFPRLTSQAS